MSYNIKFFAIVTCLVAVLSGTSSFAAPSLASHGGVYKNIALVEENGDVMGMAVEFKPSPSPSIIVTICEGECSGGKSWPAKVQGQNISFSVCQELTDQNGRSVPCEPMRFRGTFSNNTLKLNIDGQPESDIILKRLPNPSPHMVEQMACQADHC